MTKLREYLGPYWYYHWKKTLDPFIENEFKEDGLDIENHPDAIASGFNWATPSQTPIFWQRMDEGWRDFLKQEKLLEITEDAHD